MILIDFAGLGFAFRQSTPGAPPFSSMNSMPAARSIKTADRVVSIPIVFIGSIALASFGQKASSRIIVLDAVPLQSKNVDATYHPHGWPMDGKYGREDIWMVNMEGRYKSFDRKRLIAKRSRSTSA